MVPRDSWLTSHCALKIRKKWEVGKKKSSRNQGDPGRRRTSWIAQHFWLCVDGSEKSDDITIFLIECVLEASQMTAESL